MRPDVHAAALRSAAKLVLGMASIASVTVACSSETTDDTGASTDAVMTKNDNATKKNATDDDLALTGGATGEPTSKECAATLASAFPTPSGYEWTPVPQPPKVAACCDEELTKHGWTTAYRWDCCVAYDENAPLETDKEGNPIPWSAPTGMHKHVLACTPWGPPVPPQMNRLQRRNRKLSPARHDMNRFLASQIEAQLAQVA